MQPSFSGGLFSFFRGSANDAQSQQSEAQPLLAQQHPLEDVEAPISHPPASSGKPEAEQASTSSVASAAVPAVVAALVRTCRFCLGEEGEDPELGALITPCLCRDTVHQECLKKWRATNTTAFYTCNVCKWQYKFARISTWREVSIRLMVPLWPLISLLALSMALGFIPMFGPAGSDIGLHLLNGLAAVGLAYLFIIVTVFNLQYCRLTLIAARNAAASIGMVTLPVQLQVQLFGFVAARCLLVGLFFGFCMVYFFPYSGFMGFLAMVLASPPGIKELGDRLIRRLEFEQPVSEVTPEMAAEAARQREEAARAQREEAAAEAAAAAAAAAEGARVEVPGAGTEAAVPGAGEAGHVVVSVMPVAGVAGAPPLPLHQQHAPVHVAQAAAALSS